VYPVTGPDALMYEVAVRSVVPEEMWAAIIEQL
jgi:hypothetical protein